MCLVSRSAYVSSQSRAYLEPMYLGRYVSSESRAGVCLVSIERVNVQSGYVCRTRPGAPMSLLPLREAMSPRALRLCL